LVRLQAGERRGCDLFVASTHIAYIADDHVRLSITASEAITEDQSTEGPG
jgi:hypothetical protein